MFATTITGSLPKPAWLAEPNRLWAPWRPAGAELEAAKRDATILALKLQEDCGIDIVSDGEQSRQHFVHAFLESVAGVDFTRKVEMGIRADRYKAMVPTVTGALGLKARVHAREARVARAHTRRKLQFTLPGPMTIADTIADAYYGDRVKMAMAFAELLNAEARALEADGVDVIQFATFARIAAAALRLAKPSLLVGAPARPDRLDGGARDALVGLPVAARDPDAADAFAIHDDREAALHGGPALHPGREREAERVGDVERLRLRPIGRGRPLVGGRADRLGGGGMHGVEAAPVHALQQNEVAAGVRDRDRDRDAGLARGADGRRHHPFGAIVGEALAVGDIHGS
jgi:hypothetical protein